MLNDYKYKKKKEVFDDFSEDVIVENYDDLNNELQETKRNWFKIGIKTAYRKDLLQEIIPILEKIKKMQDEEVSKIEVKYNNELSKEVDKIKKKFFKS